MTWTGDAEQMLVTATAEAAAKLKPYLTEK